MTKNISDLSVLFVVPRFHTNLAAGVNALVDQGAKVTLFVRGSSLLEDHSRVSPIKLPQSITVEQMQVLVDEAAPDVAFVRPKRRMPLVALKVLAQRPINIYNYTQDPLDRLPVESNRLTRGRNGPLLERVTPIKALGIGEIDQNARYLALPVIGSPQPLVDFKPLKVLCVAKLGQARKNHFKLIEALDKSDAPDGYHLTIVGASSDKLADDSPEYLDRLYERAKQSTTNRKITILADIPHPQMSAIYTANNICVLPSVSEMRGTAPLEAMAHGRLAIISKQAGASGEIEDDVNGLLVDMELDGDLDRVIRRVAHDPDLVARLSDEAGRYAQSTFSPQAFVDQVSMLAG